MAGIVLAGHYLCAAVNGGNTRAAQLKYLVFIKNVKKAVNLAGLARFVYLANVPYGGALAFVRGDLDKQQLTKYRLILVLDLNRLDLNELFRLQNDLLDYAVIAASRKRYAGDGGVVGGGNGK